MSDRKIAKRAKAPKAPKAAKASKAAKAARAAPASPLSSDLNVDEAIGALLAARQAEMVAALRAALDRPMPETVQALRIALRGLCVALTLSARWSDTDAFDEGLRDARALSEALGETRHWDVLVSETLIGHIDALAGVADVAVLTEAAAEARHDSYRRVRALLDGPLPQKLLLGLAFLIAEQRWRGRGNTLSRRLAGNVRARAKREIVRLDKRLKGRGKQFRQISEAKRHDVQIDARELAEALELLGPLWPRPARLKRYRHDVSTLDSALDGLQATQTALRLLDHLAEDDSSPVVQRAVGAIGGWSARDRADRLTSLERLWREFRVARRVW